MRYGVIGTGWIAKSFIDGARMLCNADFAAVYSRTEENGGKFAKDKNGNYRIDYIFEGEDWDSGAKSPLRAPGVNVKCGDFIVAIDGVPAYRFSDIYEALVGKVGMTVAERAKAKGIDYRSIDIGILAAHITLAATEQGLGTCILGWLDSDLDLRGFSAADRVIGKATAYLYCLLGVKEVFARVISRPATQVLESHGIPAHCDTLVEGIQNRQKTGPCPMEHATRNCATPEEALTAVRETLKQLQQAT